MIRHLFIFLLACVSTLALPFAGRGAEAETPALLHAAIGNWIAGKEDWAFTQRMRTLADDGTVKEERLEHYDPSLPDNQRWHLLEVNGQPPTEAQRASIEHRKNQRPRKHANKPPEDFLDFPHAFPMTETARSITYQVALRPEAARLVQTDKLFLLITVGRESQAIERVAAGLREPMRVALGLAKITDVDLDMNFEPADGKLTAGTADNPPSGTARVALSKLGARMEYEWSDFKRVNAWRRDDKSAK